jgi:acetylglutamate kinase
VLTACTTGVIGVPLPVEPRSRQGARGARSASLAARSDASFAEAILTTDTVHEARLVASSSSAGPACVSWGIAKGSGMVHPNMATDPRLPPHRRGHRRGRARARRLTPTPSAETFNAVSVDRDTSTNDCVLALANGLAKNEPITSAKGEPADKLYHAMLDVCRELARAIAADGEGAQHLLTVRLTGAEDRDEARSMAKAVIESSLTKAAFFGTDPNWGRIAAALGQRAAERGVELSPSELTIRIQDVDVLVKGAPQPFDVNAVRALLRGEEVFIDIDLGRGDERAEAWGCDLSYDYVRINADYGAVLVDPEGTVRRDQDLEQKTPELKAVTLLQALRYIERFAGTRAVIKYGGSTLSRRDLALSFAEDIHLLSAVGLKPILVQEGASEIVVSALARTGIRAVGLSGADGNLLAWPSAAERSEGHPISVDPDVIETLLQKGYVPVVVPALTEEARIVVGDTTAIDVDQVAAEIARVCKARKLLLLGDSSGLSSEGMLLSELSAEELAERVRARTIEEPMRARARAAVAALESGIDSVHFLDERLPHVIVAELFTDTGVGTMVR